MNIFEKEKEMLLKQIWKFQFNELHIGNPNS